MTKKRKKEIIYTKFVKDVDKHYTEYPNLRAVENMWKIGNRNTILKFGKKLLVLCNNSILIYEEEDEE